MLKKVDKWLFFAVVLLLGIGIWMMSWVSVFDSQKKEKNVIAQSFCETQLSENSSVQAFNTCMQSKITEREVEIYCSHNNCNDRFFIKHVLGVLIALIGMGIIFFFPLGFWKKTAPLWFLIGIGLLITVLINPAKGDFTANSWLNLPGLPTFQPSEAMKLALALYAGLWMEKKKNEIESLSNGFVPYFILIAMVVTPVIMQPDFGSSLILIAIASGMFWVAGGRVLHFLYTGGIVLVIGLIAYSSIDYVRGRFNTFLNIENKEDFGDGYQLEQAHLSIGNGQWFGHSDATQSFGHLPEIKGDMIFAAIAEKVGFIGMIIVIGIYIFITLRGIGIARSAPDRFSMLVATGITTWFATQSLVNMMVVTGLFPLTGITLPLLSYGGTSLLVTLSGIGILLHISTLSYDHISSSSSGGRRKRRTHLPSARYR